MAPNSGALSYVAGFHDVILVFIVQNFRHTVQKDLRFKVYPFILIQRSKLGVAEFFHLVSV